MTAEPIRVLVVEDDPIASAAHAAYVRRVPGFIVVGTAATGADALRQLAHGPAADLVLLDLNLPDMSGMEVCRAIRAAGRRTDVIAVTSARDLAMVRAAVNQGVLQYLLKPFVFATLRERLERYAGYRTELAGAGQTVAGQQQVDRLLSGPRTPAENRLPKGLSPQSLEAMITLLRTAPQPRSASEAAQEVGMSRVSARRYLEYLCDVGMAGRSSRYGGTGRPEIEYTWRS
jgi:response regulator of citrate/malate metabolism